MEFVAFYKTPCGKTVKVHDDGAGDFVISSDGKLKTYHTIHRNDFKQSIKWALESYLSHQFNQELIDSNLTIV